MLKKDWLVGHDHLTLALLEAAIHGLEHPHRVVHLLVAEADLLIAREASIGQRSDGNTVQVEWLVHDLSIGGDSHLLSEVNTVVRRAIFVIAALQHENTASTGAYSLGSARDTISLISRCDLVCKVADEPALNLETLQHNVVAEFNAAVLSVGVHRLPENKHGKDVITLHK